MAFVSLFDRYPVGPTTVRDSTATRIPSSLSSCSMSPAGSVSRTVNVTGCGRGFPLETSVTTGEPAISVSGGLEGSLAGTNSCTWPETRTALPTTAAAGGAPPVKTKMPSDVLGSVSASGSGVCRKKPFDLRPVTTPVVATTWPA